MSPATFYRFQEQFFELYNAGNYADAGLLIQWLGGLFPERAAATYNWRICLAALTGQLEQAEQLLAEALDLDLWWPEALLRQDPDLGSLQGRPEFERLTALSAQRHQQAVASAQPEMFFYLPEEPFPKPYPVLIALHGRNGNGRETGEMWKELTDQGWLVAAAQSSQVEACNSFIWDQQDLAARQVMELAHNLFRQYPADMNRVILSGFSQGGGVAIRLALSGILRCLGFIAVAPVLPGIELLLRQNHRPLQRNLRGYLTSGKQDDQQENLAKIRSLLDARQVPYQLEQHDDLGHDYPDHFGDTIRRALNFILNEDK